MIVSTNNKFYKVLQLLKNNVPYKCIYLSAHDDSLPIVEVDEKNLNESMIFFSSTGVIGSKVLGELITLSGINPYEVCKLLKQIVDDNYRLRVFCSATLQNFVQERVKGIKPAWFGNIKADKGILLYSNTHFIYEIVRDNHALGLRLFMTQDLGGPHSVNFACHTVLDTETLETQVIYEKRYYKDKPDTETKLKPFLQNFLQIIFFLQFAQVETKIVNRKTGKTKIGGEKFINQTDIPVEVIDSHYYTTIIRTEGFGVKGHFRWQPKGAGRLDRELIWLKDYKKEGYKREAKILNQ